MKFIIINYRFYRTVLNPNIERDSHRNSPHPFALLRRFRPRIWPQGKRPSTYSSGACHGSWACSTEQPLRPLHCKLLSKKVIIYYFKLRLILGWSYDPDCADTARTRRTTHWSVSGTAPGPHSGWTGTPSARDCTATASGRCKTPRPAAPSLWGGPAPSGSTSRWVPTRPRRTSARRCHSWRPDVSRWPRRSCPDRWQSTGRKPPSRVRCPGCRWGGHVWARTRPVRPSGRRTHRPRMSPACSLELREEIFQQLDSSRWRRRLSRAGFNWGRRDVIGSIFTSEV